MNRTTTILIIVGCALFVLTAAVMVAVLVVREYSGDSSAGSFGYGLGYLELEGTIVDSRQFIRQLRSLDRNPMVKGILLRVDSPGGAVTPSHEMYSELKRVRDSGTPVVVSMGTLAASGGYYVSCASDLIVANPGTLTGSIGVIMEFPVFKGLMDKLGLDVAVIKSDSAKDVGSPFRRMNPEDRELLQGVVSDVYEQFLEIVATERELPSDSLRPIADGRIFTGRQALAYGLVDSLGTFEEAKLIAAEFSGIKGEPRLIRPRRPFRSWLVDFMESTAEGVFGWPRSARLSYRWP